MCGIVGTTGMINGVDIVLEGLTRLEYRGYDSAGLSVRNPDGSLQVHRREGKIEHLKNLIEQKKPVSSVVIGHTRWATHGVVNEQNAHPHGNDLFSIVHNGIIENAYEIKQELMNEGIVFQSDTDSEVFLQLLTLYFKQTQNIVKSIAKSFERVKGNSAFVIMSKMDEHLYAIKHGAPLVCGESAQGQLYVSSDPYALTGLTQNLIFPENSVIAHLNSDEQKISFYELNSKLSKRYKVEDKLDHQDVVSKGEFEHFMLKEIHEQPLLVQQFCHRWTEPEKRVIEQSSDLPHLFIFGCGTAWHAGLSIKNFIEKKTELRCSVELASEFRYRQPKLRKNDIAIFISQSGETADTLASAQLCREEGIQTLSIVNVKGSTLYRTCDQNYLIQAGPEIGVASTKAFTMQVLTGYWLSENLIQNKSLKSGIKPVEVLAQRIQELLGRSQEIQKIAEEVYSKKSFIFTGRGDYFPIALEGALKLKEIAYVHAEGYAAGELKHGPIALIDSEVVNIAIIAPELMDKTLSNAVEVKSRKGVIFTVGDEKQAVQMKEFSDYFLGLNFEGLAELAPLYVNVALQIFSYYVAKIKGTDIDKPRNLAKSVTVE